MQQFILSLLIVLFAVLPLFAQRFAMKPSVGDLFTSEFRQHPRYKGVVGHWIMNESGGVTAYDISGNSNHGTLTNGPVWTQGQFGPALSFDGTDDFISVAHNSALQPSSAITVALWVKTSVADKWLIEKIDNNVSPKNGYRMNGNGNGTVGFSVDNGAASIFSQTTSVITGNTWIHLVGTFDSGTTVIYYNGSQQDTDSSGPSTIGANTNSLFIGKRVNDTDYHNGLIDDVRIYNRALSADEVMSLYLDGFLEWRRRQNLAALRAQVVAAKIKHRVTQQ